MAGTIDKDKLKYTIFYFPGTGGFIVAWLLALAHDYKLLSTALECFPKELIDNQKTICDERHVPIDGWSFHENENENPYAKLICFHTRDHPIRKAYGTDRGEPGRQQLHISKKNMMDNIINLLTKHTISTFLLMSDKARTRACFEKGTYPFKTHLKVSNNVVKKEKELYTEKSLQVIKEYDTIKHLFSYNSLYNNKYIEEIETITNSELTDPHIEAMEKLVDRYISLTPPKLLKIINDENKLS